MYFESHRNFKYLYKFTRRPFVYLLSEIFPTVLNKTRNRLSIKGFRYENLTFSFIITMRTQNQRRDKLRWYCQQITYIFFNGGLNLQILSFENIGVAQTHSRYTGTNRPRLKEYSKIKSTIRPDVRRGPITRRLTMRRRFESVYLLPSGTKEWCILRDIRRTHWSVAPSTTTLSLEVLCGRCRRCQKNLGHESLLQGSEEGMK